MTKAECAITEAQQKYNIKPLILESLYNYIDAGVPCGGFLTAVLCNDLKESFGRADDFNRDHLFDIVQFLYNKAPAPCWGSPDKVKAWVEKHNERTYYDRGVDYDR